MRAPRLGLALALFGTAALASAETWDPADVAEAQRLQREEAARAAEYRERVARGDIRAESAPMPREAPQRPEGGGPSTLGDFLDRLFRRAEERAEPSERPRSRAQLRREQRERQRAQRERRGEERWQDREDRANDAENWWDEEERRMERAR
jgi:hypothetical protein